MGLEALSRGAKECYFVENGKHVLHILEANIQKTHFMSNSRILQIAAFSVKKLLADKKFHIFFVDPPYSYIDQPIERRKCLEFMAELGAEFGHPGFQMILHHRRNSMNGFPIPEPLIITDHRGYGSTEVMFLQKK